MKVVFCDFDGVLNGLETRGPPSPIHAGLFLNLVLVERVNQICEQTGARVVLSTSWRHRLHDDGRPVALDDLRAALRHVGFTGEVIGATPDMRPPGAAPKSVYTPRADEIRAWVDEHNPSMFVVLDDYSDANVDGRLVQTATRIGITDADVERAVQILGGPR